jgi:hypothetical protein
VGDGFVPFAYPASNNDRRAIEEFGLTAVLS